MDRLLQLSRRKLKELDRPFRRYLHHQIDWNQPLTMVIGSRGVGKTTLLLQRMQVEKGKSVYISLDDFYFEDHRFLLYAEDLYKKGYRCFFLDEIHQYEHWSRDLKNFHDNFPEAKVVVTGSSILQIDKGQADLSRRANVYKLYGMSFREFIKLQTNIDFDVITLDDILNNHQQLSNDISDKVDILTLFKNYLDFGYFPFYNKDKILYHQKLQQVVQLIMDIDIPVVENLNYATIRSMKKLFYIISQSVPFKPNVQTLAVRMETSRNTILKAFDILERGGVINLLRSNTIGDSYLQKPEKIFLENPNLGYTFSEGKPNIGNLRETFFYNQLKVKHQISAPKYGDFFIDGKYVFEVGGASKTAQQIRGVPQAYIAADDIKSGVDNKIALWLFGFLY